MEPTESKIAVADDKKLALMVSNTMNRNREDHHFFSIQCTPYGCTGAYFLKIRFSCYWSPNDYGRALCWNIDLSIFKQSPCSLSPPDGTIPNLPLSSCLSTPQLFTCCHSHICALSLSLHVLYGKVILVQYRYLIEHTCLILNVIHILLLGIQRRDLVSTPHASSVDRA